MVVVAFGRGGDAVVILLLMRGGERQLPERLSYMFRCRVNIARSSGTDKANSLYLCLLIAIPAGSYGWIRLLDVESAFIKSRLTILNPSSRLSFSIWSRTDDPRAFSAIAPPSKLISQGLGLGSERILSSMFSAGTC